MTSSAVMGNSSEVPSPMTVDAQALQAEYRTLVIKHCLAEVVDSEEAFEFVEEEIFHLCGGTSSKSASSTGSSDPEM